jgi:hypothetical protein
MVLSVKIVIDAATLQKPTQNLTHDYTNQQTKTSTANTPSSISNDPTGLCSTRETTVQASTGNRSVQHSTTCAPLQPHMKDLHLVPRFHNPRYEGAKAEKQGNEEDV